MAKGIIISASTAVPTAIGDTVAENIVNGVGTLLRSIATEKVAKIWELLEVTPSGVTSRTRFNRKSNLRLLCDLAAEKAAMLQGAATAPLHGRISGEVMPLVEVNFPEPGGKTPVVGKAPAKVEAPQAPEWETLGEIKEGGFWAKAWARNGEAFGLSIRYPSGKRWKQTFPTREAALEAFEALKRPEDRVPQAPAPKKTSPVAKKAPVAKKTSPAANMAAVREAAQASAAIQAAQADRLRLLGELASVRKPEKVLAVLQAHGLV